MIKDETGSIEIVLFNSLVDEVSNNTSYEFKKMRVQKFMNFLFSIFCYSIFVLKKFFCVLYQFDVAFFLPANTLEHYFPSLCFYIINHLDP